MLYSSADALFRRSMLHLAASFFEPSPPPEGPGAEIAAPPVGCGHAKAVVFHGGAAHVLLLGRRAAAFPRGPTSLHGSSPSSLF